MNFTCKKYNLDLILYMKNLKLVWKFKIFKQIMVDRFMI